MKKSQIAAQLYTLRDYTQNAADFRVICALLRDAGYTAVQVSGIGPIPWEEVRAICDEYGLRIVITHIGWDAIVNRPEEVARQHSIYGTSHLGIGSMPGEYPRTLEGYTAFAQEMVRAAAVLREYGLQLSYHNHSFEFERFSEGLGAKRGIDVLFGSFMEGGVNFILDLYWLQAAGVSPVEWIHKVKGHMHVAHLKDMAVVDNHAVMAEIGEGNMNHVDILRALDDTGVAYAAVEQDTCRRDPRESIVISYRNLLKLVEE